MTPHVDPLAAAAVAAPAVEPRAVVLLSGGIDSTVVLWWALERYREVIPVCVNWGQSTPPEQAAAGVIARLAGTALRTVRLSTPDLNLTPGDFTRGHNFSLIGAAGLHIGRDQADILIGSIPSDRHADATTRFMADATAGLVGPRDSGRVRVLAPLLDLDDKATVLRRGLEMGAPVTQSWSCNRVQRPPACQQCVSCHDRDQAWQQTCADLLADEGMTSDTVQAWIDRLGSWHHPSPRPPHGLIAEEMPAILRYRTHLPWQDGWLYPGPDGTTRFTRTTHPGRRHRRRHQWQPTRYVRVAGTDSGRWALAFQDDGTVIEQTGPAEPAIHAIAAAVTEASTQLKGAAHTNSKPRAAGLRDGRQAGVP